MKKLTTQELERVNVIKNSYDQLAYSLGQIDIQMLELEHQKNSLKTQYQEIKNQEIELGNYLETNYGKGNINLSTGEFIPK